MKLMKNGSVILLVSFLIAGFVLQCQDKQYIQYEKERFIYNALYNIRLSPIPAVRLF